MSNTLKAFPVGTAGSKLLVPRGTSGNAISGSFPNPDLNPGSVVSVAAQVSGVGDGIQGLASDGTYLYGVIGGEILYRLNVSDGTPHNPSNIELGSGAKAATYDSGTASVWVTNQSTNQVYQVLASSYSVINTYSTGANPRGITSSGAYIWITNLSDNTVTRLLASDGSAQGVFPTGAGPLGITYDGTYMWIANSIDNTVTLLLASDGSVFATYSSSGTAPTDVAASNGLVWVTNSGSNNVAGIDTGGGVQRLTAVGNTPVAITALGSSLWAVNQLDGTVTQISNVDGSVTGTFPTGGAGVAPEAITSDGSHVWVGNNGTGLNIAKMADYGLFVGPVIGGTSISGGNITGTFPDGLVVSTLTAVSGPASLDSGTITTDGSGNITAVSFHGDGSALTGIHVSPAGADTNIQFNRSGVLTGSNNFTWDESVGTFTIFTGADSFFKIGALISDPEYNMVSLNGSLAIPGFTGIMAGKSVDTSLYIDCVGIINLRPDNTGVATAVVTGTGVGIGTASPAGALDIQSSAGGTAAGLWLGKPGVSSGFISVRDNLYIHAATSGDTAPGYVQITDNTNSTQIQLNSGGPSYFSGGNLGIFTTTPAYPLDVTGDVNTTGAYRVNGVAQNFGSPYFIDSVAAPGAGTTVYAWTGTAGTSEISEQYSMPRAGVVSSLYVGVSAATAALSSTVITVRKNGVDTALSVTFGPGVSAVQSDTVDSVSFAPGDLINLEVTSGAVPAGAVSFQPSVLIS